MGAAFPIGVTGDTIFVNGQPLVMNHGAMGHLDGIAATVEGRAIRWVELGTQLLLSVYGPPPRKDYIDRTGPRDELTQWAMQTPAAKVLARAISAFTTFCALDYIRAALVQAQTTTSQSRFVLDLGEPLALVSLSPKLRISVG